MWVVALLNIGLWGSLTWMGASLLNATERPSQEQVAYYLYTPVAMLLVALTGVALARFTRFRRMALAFEIAILLFFVPFVIPYTGGI